MIDNDLDELFTEVVPDTLEVTSADVISQGPIERGTTLYPIDAHAIISDLGARADRFKAQAFEADKRVKELEMRMKDLDKVNWELEYARHTLRGRDGVDTTLRAIQRAQTLLAKATG